MFTKETSGHMVREFNTNALQQIGIVAQRFVNTLDSMNDKPWEASQMAKDDLIALRMLRDACKEVIARQQAHEAGHFGTPQQRGHADDCTCIMCHSRRLAY